MSKLWTSHEQVVSMSWTSYEQVMDRLWTSHEQVMSRLWTSHEQVMNHLSREILVSIVKLIVKVCVIIITGWLCSQVSPEIAVESERQKMEMALRKMLVSSKEMHRHGWNSVWAEITLLTTFNDRQHLQGRHPLLADNLTSNMNLYWRL